MHRKSSNFPISEGKAGGRRTSRILGGMQAVLRVRAGQAVVIHQSAVWLRPGRRSGRRVAGQGGEVLNRLCLKLIRPNEPQAQYAGARPDGAGISAGQALPRFAADLGKEGNTWRLSKRYRAII